MKISKGRRVTAAATFMAGAALIAGLTVGIAGGGAASAATKASAAPRSLQRGGVIKFAEGPGTPPNYIFPETTATYQSLYNVD